MPTCNGFLPIKVFPFAETPGGNLFAFEYRNSDDAPTVKFLDHEEEDALGHFPSTFVANSFTEFLNLLSDPDDEIQMAVAKQVMTEDREALQKLAE